MATCVWTGGAGDGNATTAGNWDTGVPVGGDTVYINEGSQDITTGLGNVALALVVIGERYRGNLVASLTTGTITTLHYRPKNQYGRFSGSVTTGTVELEGTRQLFIDGGTWTTAFVSGGIIEVAAAATMTNIRSGRKARWTIYSSGTKITLFHNGAGGEVVTTSRNIGTYFGGPDTSLTLRGTAVIADGSSTGAAYLSRGARLTFNGTGGTSDIIENEGVIDHNQTKSAQTITTLYEYPGSSVLEDVPGYTLTVTNRYRVGGSASGIGSPTPI